MTVEDGPPTERSGAADEHYEGACKHRVAVAIRRLILDTMTATGPTVVDGGQSERSTALSDVETVTDQRTDGDDPDVATEDCEECIGEFPCWECVRTDRKELPD